MKGMQAGKGLDSRDRALPLRRWHLIRQGGLREPGKVLLCTWKGEKAKGLPVFKEQEEG